MHIRYPLRLVLLTLFSAASPSPLPSEKTSSASPITASFPGDAFLQALASNPAPKFATRIPIAQASATTQHQLSLLYAATLTFNVTYPRNFLDFSREFQYPTFDNKQCELGKDTNGVYPFAASTTLSAYFEGIFLTIPDWTKGEISLTRFDLFHAHLFANPTTKTAGVVFHSKEYPADNVDTFPYDLGFCQVDSNLDFTDSIMRKRNLIWTIDADNHASMWWIDMGVKTGNNDVDSMLDGAPFYTLYEDSLGHVIADFYYLKGEELGVSLY
ncbi:hypothetical protein TWF694_007984 [Orbilia ellipsospora]|uniref:Uncharacterized protein n=1 Tax=Orbilia ellipsospora TaxID=2528407 RepID=A0AAV9XJD6_9PEZI